MLEAAREHTKNRGTETLCECNLMLVGMYISVWHQGHCRAVKGVSHRSSVCVYRFCPYAAAGLLANSVVMSLARAATPTSSTTDHGPGQLDFTQCCTECKGPTFYV